MEQRRHDDRCRVEIHHKGTTGSRSLLHPHPDPLYNHQGSERNDLVDERERYLWLHQQRRGHHDADCKRGEERFATNDHHLRRDSDGAGRDEEMHGESHGYKPTNIFREHQAHWLRGDGL